MQKLKIFDAVFRYTIVVLTFSEHVSVIYERDHCIIFYLVQCVYACECVRAVYVFACVKIVLCVQLRILPIRSFPLYPLKAVTMLRLFVCIQSCVN